MNETKKVSRRKYTAEFKAKVALEAMQENLCCIFDFYNNRRLHQSLGYQCPATVYMKKRVA